MVCRTALRWLLQLTLHLHNNTNGELGSSLITLWGISKITTDRCLLFPDTDCFCKTIGCRSSNIPSGQSKAQGWLCCKPGQRLRHHIWPLSPSSSCENDFMKHLTKKKSNKQTWLTTILQGSCFNICCQIRDLQSLCLRLHNLNVYI